MKKKFVFLLIVCSVFFCVSIFYFIKYDSKRFDYGWDCDFCDKKLPFDLEKKFYSDYQQRFYILDSDDLELVGNGFRFFSTSFIIKDFLGFGYNDTSVVVKCTDSLNTIRYLISYETGYRSKKGNPEISFKNLNNGNLEQIKRKYNWVIFNHKKAQEVTFKRFLSFLGALLSLVLIVWCLIVGKTL
jgi:hypothetical protein